MAMIKIKSKLTLLCVVFAAALLGCEAKPTYIHPSFDAQQIDRLVVLPPMDARQTPNPDHDFVMMASDATSMLVKHFKFFRKYRTVMTSDIGSVASYSPQYLPKPADPKKPDSVDPQSVDPSWVKQLGPPTAKWLLVPVVEDISLSNLLIQVSGHAKVSTYLFNKQTGEVWWKEAQRSQMSVGGLTALMSVPLAGGEKFLVERAAVEMAAMGCTKTLPERKEPFLLPSR